MNLYSFCFSFSLSRLRISFSVIFSPFYFGTFIYYLGITMRRVAPGGTGIVRLFRGMEVRETNRERRSGPPRILGLREMNECFRNNRVHSRMATEVMAAEIMANDG
jgi:hypothetical protein